MGGGVGFLDRGVGIIGGREIRVGACSLAHILPSPLAGEGGLRCLHRKTDEGAASTIQIASSRTHGRHPPHPAQERHLLPRGEKEK